jgi:ParB family chromosome partitioning protein
VLELALIENLQREDLNPIEEAQAYRRLAEEYSLRQEDIAQRVGKSRSVVANSLRLLDLHSQVQAYLAQGRLSVGHAKVLLAFQNQDEQLVAAEITIRQAATVRMTERLVASQLARQGRSGKPGARSSLGNSAMVQNAVTDLERRLRERLATHVTIQHGEKKGRIEIEYYGHDDLDRILVLLGVSV